MMKYQFNQRKRNRDHVINFFEGFEPMNAGVIEYLAKHGISVETLSKYQDMGAWFNWETFELLFEDGDIIRVIDVASLFGL